MKVRVNVFRPYQMQKKKVSFMYFSRMYKTSLVDPDFIPGLDLQLQHPEYHL